ncbi:MAG: malate dehydrogenase [Armatimonadetes bacterium]|nr:malate dehydrogenase [Armatimonadota bacterium]
MKVAVIGAGQVGATCAQRIAESDVAHVALVDVIEGLAAGKALDLTHAAPIVGHARKVLGGSDYQLVRDSSVVVVTAGRPRQPGMSREELVEVNGRIVADVVRRAAEVAAEAIFIVVTNPLDVMTYVAQRVARLPRERCIGMAGVLDSARFRAFVAERLGLAPADVQAMVLGSHGDSMVPVVSHATVAGIPLLQLLSGEEIDAIVERTRNAGAEIVALMKTSSAFYAPAAAVAEMVRAIARDQKRLLPASVMLHGEFGIDGVPIGVPVVLGRGGAERIVEIALSPAELEALRASAEATRSAIKTWLTLAGDDPEQW